MAVGELHATQIRPWDAVVDRVFAAPVWLLGVATFAAATLLHGYHYDPLAMAGNVRFVADPFTQDERIGPWVYSSPLGPWIAWMLGADTGPAIAFVHYCTTIVCVLGGAWAVAHWVGGYAARLWLLAYWCSPQSWAGTAFLGLFDIVTVAGITVVAVAPAGACFAAGVMLGVNHFEQALFAVAALTVVRCVMRRESHVPMVAAFAGLALGKAIVMWYLVSNGIDTNSRLDFIRDKGLAVMVDGWWGREFLTMEWAVYNVLWVGVIWMAATMSRRDRWLTIGLHAALTLPVLVTFDLSRVYRTVTWPIVMLLVLYAAEWPDRRLVQRAALLLAVAAIFVPRTELWYGGKVLN
jgi:hypothetical protein